ncbi:hypothetical protein J31TS4_34370 [Paenibacillus sp. J31TS4]|uniref:hypothetical protein n=1 Tax=Paenibacillus sp. J31TS4 TaxID=2807195 RepID=UPI001B075CF4|nr:hypothetical protein [Paenibacillus sp. J31TS4]GIP40157.1 hypothetical protein J31TS4_34370 [Paenibacillus sp. J31TS4]
MSYVEMLNRRNKIMKKHVERMILKDNQTGLSYQEDNLYQMMLRELYQNESELNAARREDADV